MTYIDVVSRDVTSDSRDRTSEYILIEVESLYSRFNRKGKRLWAQYWRPLAKTAILTTTTIVAVLIGYCMGLLATLILVVISAGSVSFIWQVLGVIAAIALILLPMWIGIWLGQMAFEIIDLLY